MEQSNLFSLAKNSLISITREKLKNDKFYFIDASSVCSLLVDFSRGRGFLDEMKEYFKDREFVVNFKEGNKNEFLISLDDQDKKKINITFTVKITPQTNGHLLFDIENTMLCLDEIENKLFSGIVKKIMLIYY